MHRSADRPPSRASLPRAAVVGLWAIVASLVAGLAALALAIPPIQEDWWAFPLYATIVMTWAVSGTFLATRRPDNVVGWILLAAGAGMGLALLGQLWAYLSFAAWNGALPLTVAGGILGLLFNPALMLVMLVPLFFPDGRLMSRRWRSVAGLLLLSAASILVGIVIRPGPVEGIPVLDNPFGVPALAGLSQTLIDAGNVGSLICLPAGITAAVLRYRRGTPLERRQLKWFGSVVVLALSLFLSATVLPQPYGQGAWIGASFSLGLVPVAILVAILRYRLYEIDRIVSRTLSYALITALLAVVFVTTNLGLQAVVSNATGGSTLAVAGSTLLVAALFQPVRRWIQAPIDRRFNRAHTDADGVVAAFAALTRDEVDLRELRRSIHATAREAVHPAGSALWLRADR
jgi:hypothetical protein